MRKKIFDTISRLFVEKVTFLRNTFEFLMFFNRDYS